MSSRTEGLSSRGRPRRSHCPSPAPATAKAERRDLRLLELERELLGLTGQLGTLCLEIKRRDLLGKLERELLELRNAELAREAETAKRGLGELRARNAEREADEASAKREADEARAERQADDFWARLRKEADEISAERKRRLGPERTGA